MAFDPVRSTGLAAQLFRPGTPQAFALVRAAWSTAVGPELARRTLVQAMVGRTLHVRVPDAAWRKTLHRMRREVLSRLQAIAGELAPQALGFVEGALPALAPPAAAKGPASPFVVPEALRAEASRIADPEIQARFLATAARYLARAAPSRPAGGPSHA